MLRQWTGVLVVAAVLLEWTGGHGQDAPRTDTGAEELAQCYVDLDDQLMRYKDAQRAVVGSYATDELSLRRINQRLQQALARQRAKYQDELRTVTEQRDACKQQTEQTCREAEPPAR